MVAAFNRAFEQVPQWQGYEKPKMHLFETIRASAVRPAPLPCGRGGPWGAVWDGQAARCRGALHTAVVVVAAVDCVVVVDVVVLALVVVGVVGGFRQCVY